MRLAARTLITRVALALHIVTMPTMRVAAGIARNKPTRSTSEGTAARIHGRLYRSRVLAATLGAVADSILPIESGRQRSLVT